MEFDANGNMTSLEDASNNETTFAYDTLNRKISETDPLGESATFAYNAVGLMTSTTDRLDRRRDFQFDALNRMTTEIWYNSGGTEVATMMYSFDANSNMETAEDSNGTYTMSYDALNRVTVVKDIWGKTLTMSYDAVGNRTKVEDSDGGVTTSTYGAVNNLTKREFGGASQTPLRIDFSYTSLNQLEDITRYSDLAGTTTIATTDYSYDALGRIDNLHHKDSSTNNIANFTYAYDSAGNLETEELNGTTTTYVHDDANQLTADGTNTFTFDGTGNRDNGSYSTGTGNRLTTDGTWTWSYDEEGNVTKKTKGLNDETWEYGYDHNNQMTWAEKRATDGGTLQLRADYEYDAFQNRIQKELDTDGDSTVDATTRFAYDGWKPGGGFVGNENWDVWADLNGSNTLTTRYIRGDNIDEIFARIQSGTAAWNLTDRLYSVRNVLDDTGAVQTTIVYDGYGQIASETNKPWRGRYTFTGRELDEETNLQYNRARYYDSSVGRWTSQDPLGFDAGDSNLYRYAYNQPVLYTDASGLCGGISDTIERWIKSLEREKDGLKALIRIQDRTIASFNSAIKKAQGKVTDLNRMITDAKKVLKVNPPLIQAAREAVREALLLDNKRLFREALAAQFALTRELSKAKGNLPEFERDVKGYRASINSLKDQRFSIELIRSGSKRRLQDIESLLKSLKKQQHSCFSWSPDNPTVTRVQTAIFWELSVDSG